MDSLSINSPCFSKLLQDIQDISHCIYHNGWSEANAGNLSIRVTDFCKDFLLEGQECFTVSKSGSRYRQIAKDPTAGLVLVYASQNSSEFTSDAMPTSEWNSHYALHKSYPSQTCVLHTHPSELIALSRFPDFKDENGINDILKKLLPELFLYLPEGIGVAPYCTPGTESLCNATLEAMRNRKAVVWSAHGIITIGNDIHEAFDYQEIIVKAAKIALMTRFS